MFSLHQPKSLASQASSLPKESFEIQHIKHGNLDKDTVKKVRIVV